MAFGRAELLDASGTTKDSRIKKSTVLDVERSVDRVESDNALFAKGCQRLRCLTTRQPPVFHGVVYEAIYRDEAAESNVTQARLDGLQCSGFTSLFRQDLV